MAAEVALMPVTPRRTLLIDADDTLWENDRHYRASTQRFIALLASLGADTTSAQALVDACEHEQIAVGGYGPTSFTAALLTAAQRMLAPLGRIVDEAIETQVRACSARLFDAHVDLLPDVASTIAALAERCALTLVTKGEERFQLEKLAGSRLAPYFTHARVLRHKETSAYARLVADLQLDLALTWMVGNSPRSDINPALLAGLGAVYIPHDDTWHQELEPLLTSPRLVTLKRFAELRGLFAPDGSA
jgi:putative hydrolase of the HAD superfamily